VKAHRRGRSDGLKAVVRLGLRPSGVVRLDVHQWATCAWGASDGARLDAMVAAFPALRPHHLGVDAGRSADQALDVLVPDGFPSVLKVLPLDELARSRPGAAPSGE
jgi:hypothetical protein